MKKYLLIAIRLLVSLSLLYGAVFWKFAGVPFSIQLFTTMSNAIHGLVSQPVFRIGSGVIECVGALLFLIPRTVRVGAVIIICFMTGVVFSHILVLGYGYAFLDAVITLLLPCVYLYLSRRQKQGHRQLS